MILLLKGLATATAAAAKNVKAMKYRVASIFIVQDIYTIRISQLESSPVAVQKRNRDEHQQPKQRIPSELLNTKVPWLRAVRSLNSLLVFGDIKGFPDLAAGGINSDNY
jgi:hypothetical protein